MHKLSDVLENGGYTKALAGDDFQKIVDAGLSIFKEGSKAGLFLLGNVGCGKTTAINIMFPNSVFVDMSDRLSHKLLEPHVADRRVDGGVYEREGWWTIVDDDNVIIDDLGSEPAKLDYGKPNEVFSTFIMHFNTASYKRSDKQARLFITSNLSEPELLARYGKRTMDRVYEMCTPVTLLQKSHRKYQPRF